MCPFVCFNYLILIKRQLQRLEQAIIEAIAEY